MQILFFSLKLDILKKKMIYPEILRLEELAGLVFSVFQEVQMLNSYSATDCYISGLHMG